MSGVPSGGSTIKNIIIGVLTTVVAYVIVHFLFDNTDKKEKAKKKKATIEAWNNLLKFEKLSTTNFYAALCIEDVGSQIERMIYEKDQLVKNYEIIKSQPGIDEDMAAFTSRAIGFTNELKHSMEDYYTEFNAIQNNASLDLQQKEAALAQLDEPFQQKMNMISKRDSAALSTILTTLVDKYGKEFISKEETPQVTVDYVTGRWKEGGIDKTFEFTDNKKFVMHIGGADYSGVWKLVDNTIQLEFDSDKSKLLMHIIYSSPQYFRFRMNNETMERQCCKP